SLGDFDLRRTQASLQKRRIAQHMASLISDGETILLDGGTTTLEVARQLTGKSLQVVTNSMPIAGLLMNRPDVELIFVGGYVYPRTGVALGELAVAALQHIHVGRLVMGTGGIASNGLFNSNALLVETERQMIRAAERVSVVADSSKFGQRALSHLCPLEAVHELVTDDGVSETWLKDLQMRGIHVEVASTKTSPNAAGQMMESVSR
ncbi:MAG: DeoR/GlpR transcriptional regulator, partial [Planctomycetaceae bacterium]|nr:DeoR/GlpR transcriptional regulator [Planctomycetaceae bacterium]